MRDSYPPLNLFVTSCGKVLHLIRQESIKGCPGSDEDCVYMPEQIDHPFRFKLDTHSAANRPLIPEETEQAFRIKSSTDSRSNRLFSQETRNLFLGENSQE